MAHQSDACFVQTLPRPHARNHSDNDITLDDLNEPEHARLLSGSEEDQSGPDDSTDSADSTRTPSILTHRVLLAIINFGFIAFLEIAFSALLPVFLASSPVVGGLGLSPPSIGSVLGTLGLANGLIQITFFVPVHKFFGTRPLFTLGVAAFAGIYGLMPLTSRWVDVYSGSIGWQSWALLGIIGLLCPLENMAFSSSPNTAALGINTDKSN